MAKRGAATVALRVRAPLVPAFFQGPKQMQVAHLLHRLLPRCDIQIAWSQSLLAMTRARSASRECFRTSPRVFDHTNAEDMMAWLDRVATRAAAAGVRAQSSR